MKCALTVVAAALAFAAFAEGPQGEKMAPRGRMGMGMGGMGGGMMMEPVVRAVLNPQVAEKLGVTAEQVEKLKALADGREANRALQEKMRKGMERQSELLKAEKVDEAAVMAAIDEVWEVRKEMAKAQTRRVIAVKSILTPDQVSKALEMMREMHGKRAQGEGKRGPRAGRRDAKEAATEAQPAATCAAAACKDACDAPKAAEAK